MNIASSILVVVQIVNKKIVISY